MARLRNALQISVALILTLAMVHASVYGAAVLGFGTVVYADRAHVGRAAASVGTTIFSGDNLDTEQLGTLQLRTGAARLLLSGASRVTLGAEESTPAATLTAGTATFSTANSKAFAVRVASAVIRPSGEDPTIGRVAVLNPKELTVQCTRGALTMTVIDDTLEIPEGMAYHIVLDPGPEPLPTDNPKTWNGNQRPKKSGRNRFIFFLIFGGAALTALALRSALESPDRP